MKLSTPSLMRMMLILSPCAALTSFDLNAEFKHGSPEDYKMLIASGKTGVVMIGSDGCGHCKAAGPHFEAIAQEPEFTAIEFLKLKRDENDALVNERQIDGVPAFLFIKGGNVESQELGFENEAKLREMISAKVGGSTNEQVETTGEVTPVDCAAGDVCTNVDAEAPVESAPMGDDEGILGKLKGLFVGLFETIKNIFVSIFDWIKGLFNR